MWPKCGNHLLSVIPEGRLILSPVSWRFVFCRSLEQEPLNGSSWRFPSIAAIPLCLPREKTGPKTNKTKRSVKHKQVNKRKEIKKARNACICPQCLREALKAEEPKPKAVRFRLQNLYQDSRPLLTYFHSDDTKLTSHLNGLLTAETKLLLPAYEKC